MVPIPSDSHLLPCLSKRRRGGEKEANQYCHLQLQIKHHPLLLPPCFCCCLFFLVVFFGAIQSAVTVTNASQSIAGEISKLTTRVSRLLFFFSSSSSSSCPTPTSTALPVPLHLRPHRLQNGQRAKQWSRAHKKTAVINKHNKTLI